MPKLDDYNAWEEEKNRGAVGAANVVIGSAAVQKPDEVAGDMALASEYSKTTGNPTPPLSMVNEYRGLFQQKVQEHKNTTILSTSPRLTEWLRDPENASVAYDDLSGLSWWEGMGRAAVGTAQRAGSRIAEMGNQYMLEQTAGRAQDRKMSFGQILDSERVPLPNGEKLAASLPEVVGAFGRWADARYADLIGTDDKAAAEGYAANLQANLNRMAEIPKSLAAQEFENTARVENGTFGETLASYASAVLKHPMGALAWSLETAGESAPVMGAALAATLATKNPALGVGMMGGGSYMTERYTAPADFLKEKGLNLGRLEDIQKLLGDPALMKEAAERGVIRGAVVGMFDAVSGGLAGKALSKTHVVDMLGQALTQAVLGGSGEYFGRVAAGQKNDWNDVIAEAFAGLASTPVDVAIAGRSFWKDRERAAAAEDRKGLFDQLSGNAQTSEVRRRLPEKFRQFVAKATEGGPVENVFIPADQFTNYFQGLGVDPHELVDSLEGVTREDLDAALAAGGDLQIPTATYAAHIAGSEHDAFLMENMRFNPNDFTAAEAVDFNSRAQDILDEAWTAAEDARQETEGLRSFEQEIRDTIISRLRVAGRSTDVANAEAALYPAFYENYGARNGMTPDEFMEKYVLPRIEGALPQGMQFRNVDELNRTLVAARSRKSVKDKRQTLLEFIDAHGGINDPGGELKSRDAETINRGRGKKAIKLRRSSITEGMASMFGASGKKHGVEEVARAAIDAGFLADDPVAHEYKAAMESGGQVPDVSPALWAAIDRELGGEAQYSANEKVDPAVEHQSALDGVEQYLDGLGVSLENDDATIRAAVEKDQAGRKYGQGAGGSIQIPATGIGDGQSVIRLFEGANLSTFVHETGHFFLSIMQDLAVRGEATAAADLDVAKAWWLSNAGDVAADAMRVTPDVTVTAEDVQAAIERGTTGDVLKDGAIDVGMQEQWARGFEAYLMEGTAPSVELRGAFEKFRAWLISVYKKLAGLNVNVSPELRAVFDRMLASDAEIAKAQNDTGGAAPVFATAEAMGLSPDEYARFLTLRDQSEAEAKAKLLAEVMAPIKREREKWFKAEKATVRGEVENEVNAYRYYRAFEWMANKQWLGEGAPANLPELRLSKDILIERYGPGITSTLPRGKQAIYATEGGIDPDVAAGWFGFDSGDEMIRAIEKAPKRKEAIDAETDKRMVDRHGDVLADGSVEALALDAVHGDKRGQWIAAELKAIGDVAGAKVNLTAKEARATARATLGRTKVRDAVNDGRFLAAERKAGAEAARLGAMLAREKIWMDNARRRISTTARAALRREGTVDAVAAAIDANNAKFETTATDYTVADRTVTGKDGVEKTVKGGDRTATKLGYNDLVAKLIDAKRRQLHNHALYSEAVKVADEVAKAKRYIARLNKASARESIAGAGRRENAGIDYLAAIDDILERYDFRKMTGPAEQRRGSLNSFIAAMTAAGREGELSIPQSVLDDAGRAPYKTIPVEELRGVIDTLKNLEHVARRWDKLIDAENERVLTELTDGVKKSFEDNVKKRPPGRVKTKGEAFRNAGRQFLDLVLNATTLLREIDGFKDQGAAYQAIKAPIDKAMNRLIVRKLAAADALEGLYSVYSKAERRGMAVRAHMPELGYALSKWERLSVALNMGNEGNRQRLTDPRVRGSLTADQVSAVLASLDERDAKFVQSVWDYVGTFRDDIGAREKRTTGVEPAWVEASPVSIGGKELRGGYYPLSYDARLSALARDDAANDIATSIQAGRFGKAQTRNGHTKERAKSSGRDIELDISVLHRHVNRVIYDLELSEAVSNSWRVLQDSGVRGSFMEAGKQADFDALELWLKDTAEGQIRSSDWVGKASRSVKSNFTAAKLAFNLATAAMQITGLSQSMVVVGKRDMAIGVGKTMANPIRVANEVAAKSPFMAERQTTFNKDINDYYSDSQIGPVASRWGEIKSEIIGPLSFYLMTKVQWHVADVPTWMAGYHQGLRKFGNDEAKAIAHADDTVKRSQASGLFPDRSAIERGTVSRNNRQNDFIRLFTALGSYMFAKGNVAYERTMVANRTIRDEGLSLKSAVEALSYSMDMALLFTFEAVVIAMIKGRLPSDGDQDDPKNDTWLKFLARETGLNILGVIPFVRDAAGPLQGYDGGGSYGSITKEAAEPFKQALTGHSNKTLIKSVINATGLATGIPSTQINRFVDGVARQNSGEDVSPLEFLLGRRKK